MPSAYLLLSHGSRDPRPQAAMERLARLTAESKLRRVESNSWKQTVHNHGCYRTTQHYPDKSFDSRQLVALPSSEPLVSTAYLELSPEPLHEQIKKFGERALAAGCNSIQVVPLFLLPGMHVMEDIPDQVAIARQVLSEQLEVDLRPYLGTHPKILSLLASQIVSESKDAWILLAHGSSRAGFKPQVEAMAKQLSALGKQSEVFCGAVANNKELSSLDYVVPAYWATSPNLASRVKQLASAGYQRIGVLPYFLFAGRITDAIFQSVEQFKVQFPNVDFELAEPLGSNTELVDLIVDLID